MQSILDNDLYKRNMGAAVLMLYPDAFVKYKLIVRGNHKFNKEFELALRDRLYQIDDLSIYFSTISNVILRL